jgi:hypothetical protein
VTDRVMTLVWRDERGEVICRSAPVSPGMKKIGIPGAARTADLISEPPDEESSCWPSQQS